MIDLKLVHEINEIVRKAGKLLENLSLDPLMRKPVDKLDGSPVTPADLMVSEFLIKALAPLGIPVISEENMTASIKGAQRFFLVDPLDGTKYFASGSNEFAICVGLIEKQKPIYGAIYDPTLSKLYWAALGQGAYCDDQPIQHSGAGQSLVAYSSGFHQRLEKNIIIDRLNITEIREKGSALKFCDIALGEVDLYLRFGPTSEWDTAAGQILLEEAQCLLYEVKTLRPMLYGKKNFLNHGIVVAHKDTMPDVVKLLKEYLGKWTIDSKGNE